MTGKALKGRKLSIEHRKKIGDGLRLKYATCQEFLAKRRIKRGPMSDEAREHIRQSLIGHSVSEETRRKIGLSGIGRVSARKGKHLTEHTKRLLSLKIKGQFHHTPEAIEKIRKAGTGRVFSEETKLKIRLGIAAHRKKLGIDGQNVGKIEKKILDTIERKTGMRLERQFETIGYYIDGYCKETNTAYEIDEPKHHETRQMIRDVIRQRRIQEHLGCKFVRIEVRRDGTWQE